MLQADLRRVGRSCQGEARCDGGCGRSLSLIYRFWWGLVGGGVVFPAAEGVEEFGAGGGGEGVFGELAGEVDGAARLLDIVGAAGAAGEMGFKARDVGGREGVFQIFGYQLYQFLAGQFCSIHVTVSSPSSSAPAPLAPLRAHGAKAPFD